MPPGTHHPEGNGLVSYRILRVVLVAAAAILPLQAAPSAAAASVPTITAIAAGFGHTCALISGGGVKCWGWNNQGQLGDGTTIDSRVPVDVHGLTSGVTAIAAGGGHTCALSSGGGVKCWGDNGYVLPGDGSSTQSNVPVNIVGLSSGVTAIAAGGYHTCALTNGGGVKCWGSNNYGQLGNRSMTDSSVPVDVSSLTSGVTAIAAGQEHTCALTGDRAVKCWGWNGAGQLGNGSTTDSLTPVDVSGLASGVSTIAAGNEHSCALTSRGGAKCWGNNNAGQLGNARTTGSFTPVDVSGHSSGATAIAAGSFHTCTVTTAGGVTCWGFNRFGQLGNGTTIDENVAVDVSGLASGVSAIGVGGGHTCALTSVGGAKCWGDNVYGQLGNGTTTNSLIPVAVVVVSSPALDACPSLPTDAATLLAFASNGPTSPVAAAALACFGRRVITVDAYVPSDVAIGAPGFPEVEPAWLSPYGLPQAVVQASPTSTGLGVRVPPRLQGCAGAPPVSYPGCPFAGFAGRLVRLSGHFNDPLARTCLFVSPPPGGRPSRVELITLCRQEFVVDSVRSLDGTLPRTDAVGSSVIGPELPGTRGRPADFPILPMLASLSLGVAMLLRQRALRVPTGNDLKP